MTDRHAARLIKNGVTVMIAALVGGFVLDAFMLGAISLSPAPVSIPLLIAGSEHGWRAVHVGGLMNGVMAVAVGLAMRRFVLSDRDGAIVSWGAIIAIWGNFVFYLFGMFAPNHGLTLAGNRLGPGNLAGAIAFAPALIGAITLVTALVILLRAKPAS